MNAAVPATAFRAADRISAIGVSDIVRITQAANELKRQGQPVIVLGLGEPGSVGGHVQTHRYEGQHGED